jgi:hypothetical protein
MVCYSKKRAIVNTVNFDWRLIALLLFVFLIFFSRSIQTNIVVLAIGAAWALQAGLAPWRGRRSILGGTKVSYWRGQRIVTKQPARARLRAVSSVQWAVSLVYVTLGLGMAAAAVLLFIRLV